MQRSCASDGKQLGGCVNEVSSCSAFSAAKSSSVKANLPSQGVQNAVPTFQGLCVQLHPRKLRFQKLKCKKSSTNTQFVASSGSFSGFGAFCKSHFCWRSNLTQAIYGQVQALGALTQASTVIVPPPKEDLAEFM